MPHSDINGSLSKTRKYAPLGFTDWPPSPRIPGLPFRRRGGGLAPGPAPAVPPPTQRVRSLGHAHSGPRHRQPHHPLSSSVLQARAARSSPAPPQAAQSTPGPAPRSSPRTPPCAHCACAGVSGSGPCGPGSFVSRLESELDTEP